MTRRVITAACFVYLVSASVALAGTSLDPYEGEGGSVQDDVAGSALTGQGGGEAGSLPFTGLDLGLLVLAGLALVLVGMGIRRLARSRG